MTDAAFRDDIRRNLTASARRRRRLYYRGLEAAADASAWLCGLLAAAWVTHDVDQAGRIAERTVHLEDGRLVEPDPPANGESA